MRKVVIIKYGELWLKSEPVRKLFARKLASNLEKMLWKRGLRNFSVRRFRDMMVLETKGKLPAKAEDALGKLFGISWYAEAYEARPTLKSMEKAVLKLSKGIGKEDTFAIRATRSHKKLPYTSMQVEREMGDLIDGKVDLKNPGFTIFIEARKERAYVYNEKKRGPGGLPYGVSGRAVSLISDGIDSPVASWLIMRRGCALKFVNFHTDDRTTQKVSHIVGKLGEYSPVEMRMHTVPFRKMLETLTKTCDVRLTCVLCKRLMYRCAGAFAATGRAKALVTGENLGQVASQTLDNLLSNDSVVSMPVLRPLIGMDKNEIIALAKEIGTYGISTGTPSKCDFVPRKPETKAEKERVDREEKKIRRLKSLLMEGLKKSGEERI